MTTDLKSKLIFALTEAAIDTSYLAAGLKLALTSTTDNNDTTEGSTISYDNINPTEDPTTSDLTAGLILC